VRTRPDLERGYFAFVLIGIALLQIGQTGLTSFAQKLRQEQTTGTFEALMAVPTRPSLLILSSAAYDLLRATALGIVMIVLGLVIFDLRLEESASSYLLALVALAGSIAVFAALGVAVAAFTVVFKQSAALLGAVVGVLALLGGVWYPVSVLPTPVRTIARLVPFTWALDALRASLLRGDADVRDLLLLLAAALAGVPLALLLFSFALRRARQAGSLAQY
jgi:ABC-2 type transport system permease protein